MKVNTLKQRDTAQAEKASRQEAQDSRVYVSLHDLLRLQHKAAGFSFLPKQPIHSLLSGRHASRLRGRGLNFEEMRHYQPGDDIRTIDWKVTARTRKPHTRVFTEERDRPGLLLVDQRQSMFFGTRVNMKSVMFFGTRVNMKSVTAAHGAALAAWRLIAVGDRVGAIIFNDHDLVEIRPHRSRNTVMRIMQSIVEMNHTLCADAVKETNPGMLNHVLEQATRTAKHDYIVSIFSDFEGTDDNTRRHMLKLSHHNDVIGVLVHDPSATQLPSSENLIVSNGELQVEVKLGKERIRKDIEEFFQGRINTVLGWQKEIGIPMIPINTEEDVVVQVRTLLGGRR